MSDPVLYEKTGHVVTMTYNRPERMNAINGPMREALNEAWLRFRDDTEAWVAICHRGWPRLLCGRRRSRRRRGWHVCRHVLGKADH